MSNIFKKKQTNISVITDNKFNIDINQNKSQSQYMLKNQIIYYPSSNKEWYNSIYAYDMSYIKYLVNTDNIVNNLFKSYTNMIINKIKILFKRRRAKKNRLSANRIYISKVEMKHTNKKVIITLYTYNKQKYLLKQKIKNIIKNIYTKKKIYYIFAIKKRIKNLIQNIYYYNKLHRSFKHVLKNINNINNLYLKKQSSILKNTYFKHAIKNIKKKLNTINFFKCELRTLKKNRLWYIFKKRFIFFKTWEFITLKKRNNILLLLLSKISNKYLLQYKTKTQRKTQNIKKLFLLKKLLLLEERIFFYVKQLNFNRCKFTNLFLNSNGLGLISLISKIYNKKVELRIIELKSIHLNSDIFSSAIALKLRNRKNKVVKVLRKALLKPKLAPLHLLLTSDNNISNLNKYNVLNFIKQKVISGIRFEASGRLTRRLTASRSVFKYRYIGSLKNIHSSYNNLSSVMLRGHVKSNLQYTMINSKTRNGAFGLKGWVSSH